MKMNYFNSADELHRAALAIGKRAILIGAILNLVLSIQPRPDYGKTGQCYLASSTTGKAGSPQPKHFTGVWEYLNKKKEK